MTTVIPSYLMDEWWTPSSGTGTAILDASTGEAVASANVAGIDIPAAILYARSVGQAGLGALTIHERALKLKELAQFLN
ncbi:MAG TPA: phenylacetic acid degradation bifunctional protein PaaZ, partial [Terrimesophilobacter sp.]|nr:phenylacetic acid degradation bifunctional protein PaaZ [Terrimesophilobacter sp.]